MIYNNYSKLLEGIQKYFLNLDVSNIIEEIKKETILKKSTEDQTWFDISGGNLHTDEDTPEDQDIKFPIENDYQVIKFFNNKNNFKIEKTIDKFFRDVNLFLLSFPEVEYVHLHSMKNFCIDSHVDGNIVLIVNLNYPAMSTTIECGLKIDQEFYAPSLETVWLDTNLLHSAWNYTNKEWKFLAISIDRQYLG
jgi:hypothetical protein